MAEARNSPLDELFSAQTKPPSLVVTLLGTGALLPEIERFGPSTLVEAGRSKFLFDFGRGVTMRLAQLKIHPSSITMNFLTHFHSDHVVGLPDLWLSSMIQSIDGSGIGRKGPMPITGPTGTRVLTDGLKNAFAADVVLRCTCDGTPVEAGHFNLIEFTEGGVVFEDADTRVTAFEVDHSERIKPAYGFRVDHRGLSAVISGDTRYCRNLIEKSKGVDLLVHEVMMARLAAIRAPNSRVPQVLTHHIDPLRAGEVFAEVSPKLAVYTHLILPKGGGAPSPSPDELLQETKSIYPGPVHVGNDLDRFVVTSSGVEVLSFDHRSKQHAAYVLTNSGAV